MLYEILVAELNTIRDISQTFPSFLFSNKDMYLESYQHYDWVKCLLSRNSGHRFFYNCLSEILCRLLYTHPLLEAHVVSGEGSGLILGEWHSQGYDHMLVVFVLLLLEETTITLKVFSWRFPFNLVWKCTIMLSKNSWHLVLEVEIYWQQVLCVWTRNEISYRVVFIVHEWGRCFLVTCGFTEGCSTCTNGGLLLGKVLQKVR